MVCVNDSRLSATFNGQAPAELHRVLNAFTEGVELEVAIPISEIMPLRDPYASAGLQAVRGMLVRRKGLDWNEGYWRQSSYGNQGRVMRGDPRG